MTTRRREKRGAALLGMLAALSLAALRPARAQTQTGAEKPFDLAAFLRTAADYCLRLESVALHFTCLEEINEKVDQTRDIENPPAPTRNWTVDTEGKLASSLTIRSWAPFRGRLSLVYDYQCIRAFNGAIRDTRTLIEQNGKKKHVPEAKMDMTTFELDRTMLGPIYIFAERFQSEYDYAVVGRDRFERKPVVIVEAKPKPGAPPSRNLFGKAWVDLATNEILKIEWDESRIGRYEIFRDRGKDTSSRPGSRSPLSSASRRTASAFPRRCSSRRPTSTSAAVSSSARKRR